MQREETKRQVTFRAESERINKEKREQNALCETEIRRSIIV